MSKANTCAITLLSSARGSSHRQDLWRGPRVAHPSGRVTRNVGNAVSHEDASEDTYQPSASRLCWGRRAMSLISRPSSRHECDRETITSEVIETRRPRVQKGSMHTPQRVELPQGPIHYVECGSRGPVVVFVHGLLVDHRVFGDVPERLAAKGFRSIVPDWPLGAHPEGMNADADLSPHGVAKLIADFIEKLGLTEVTLVGNDSGGALCQMVATRHPERIGRLALTTCDAFECFPPPAFKYLLLAARVPGVMAMLSASMRAVPMMQRLPNAYGKLTKKRLEQSLVDAWVAPTVKAEIRRDVGKFMRAIDERDTLAAADALADFKRPVLIAWTPEDKFFPVSLAHRLKERVPHARLELIEDALVFVSLDQPERVAALLADFGSTAKVNAA